jgi:GAF domain-containing protein
LVHDVRVPAGTPASAGTVGGPGLNTLETNLAILTSAACAAIEWAEFASVSVAYGTTRLEAGSVSTFGATSPIALKADALQWELGVGPTVEAADIRALIHVDDLRLDDERWPAYISRARELGLVSQTAVAVEDEARVVGVLTLYSSSPHSVDKSSEALVRLFAAQAAAAIGFATRIEALTEAITNRQVIGQAVGLLMGRLGLSEGAAFDRLVAESQRTQVKLRRIARSMVGEANAQAS